MFSLFIEDVMIDGYLECGIISGCEWRGSRLVRRVSIFEWIGKFIH